MNSRRRPKQHPRFTGEKATLVNEGVHYEDVRSLESRVESAILRGATAALVSEDARQAPVVEKFPNIGMQGKPLNYPLINIDLSHKNFSGSTTKDRWMEDVRLCGAILDGMTFSTSTFCGVDMRGASCRDTVFNYVSFKKVCMQNVDFTGAKFIGASASTVVDVDVTDSNTTREQIDMLGRLENHAPARAKSYYGVIKYRQWKLDEIFEAFDVEEKELGVIFWGSDVEVRDNMTYELVTLPNFDPSRHHIPQWEVQALGLRKRDEGTSP